MRGDVEGRVGSVPPTVEDGEVVEVARGRVREYFNSGAGGKGKAVAKL